MSTRTPVTDKDGNKPYRSNDEGLANSNITRPAPPETDRTADTQPSGGSQDKGTTPPDTPR